jgi:hypothetical protein
MADKEIHDFTAVSVPALTDIHIVNQASTALRETTAQIFTLINSTNIDFVSAGWKTDVNTWTAVSGSFDANFPNFVFTIAADASVYLYVGQKIKYTQTTVKYGIIVKVAYSSPNTTVTVYGGGTKASPSYEMTSTAITYPYYATTYRPLDFPNGESTWTTKFSSAVACRKDTNDAYWWGGTTHPWVIGSAQTLYIGTGKWNLDYNFTTHVGTSAYLYVTLSSSEAAESDAELTGYALTNSTTRIWQKQKDIILTAITQYWILVKSTDTTYLDGDANASIVRVKCAYV